MPEHSLKGCTVVGGLGFQGLTRWTKVLFKNCCCRGVEAMFRNFLRRADRSFVVLHGLLWLVVITVWTFAWRVEPGPMGPPFNFAKRFLSRIDGIVSGSIDAVSVSLAKLTSSWFGFDLGLTFTLIFACLILAGGTLQWFLIGRLLQWVGTRYGQLGASIVTLGIAMCVTFAGISWAMSW